MLKKILNNINSSSKIIILFILILILYITSSIYLILFISTLILILLILFDKSVKECITYLKNVVLLLLFLTLIYIIILKDYSVWNILIFCYRNLLSLFLIKLFILDENFEKLHSGIYSLLSHFKKGIKNLDSISFDITMSFYYINFLLESKNYIKELKKSKIKKYNFIKYNLIPRLIFADNESKKFINALKLNFYNIKKEKKNLKSKVFVFLSLILFVLTILKEVVK